MGVIISLATADFGPADYKRRRAAKRAGIDVDHFVELYEPTVRRIAYAAASVGFDPLSVCRVLGYELDSWPATETELRAACTLTDGGSTLDRDETEWLGEVSREVLAVFETDTLSVARIRTIENTCDTAVALQVAPRIAAT
ncbi:hypothetical protein C479_13328 [Halovivax asiaticus JCM 14624]|uniref:Uncharacterized protein n=2 Tax=Halovivax asiaticus TaxID=332953 RepID=M0BDE2_9EURY|nr:hypothetical protein C479_13328 [Halovivax asiaticus JCM 14624]